MDSQENKLLTTLAKIASCSAEFLGLLYHLSWHPCSYSTFSIQAKLPESNECALYTHIPLHSACVPALLCPLMGSTTGYDCRRSWTAIYPRTSAHSPRSSSAPDAVLNCQQDDKRPSQPFPVGADLKTIQELRHVPPPRLAGEYNLCNVK